jgi:hypothetical protein
VLGTLAPGATFIYRGIGSLVLPSSARRRTNAPFASFRVRGELLQAASRSFAVTLDVDPRSSRSRPRRAPRRARSDGSVPGDTWHATVEEAEVAAEELFELRRGEWILWSRVVRPDRSLELTGRSRSSQRAPDQSLNGSKAVPLNL